MPITRASCQIAVLAKIDLQGSRADAYGVHVADLSNSSSIPHGKDGAAGALHLQELICLQRLPVLLSPCTTTHHQSTGCQLSLNWMSVN